MRIGLLAALLLGPSAALALGVRLPGLVTGARDAVVLAVYLGALFGVGVAVLVARRHASLLGWLASRPRGDAAIERMGPRLARLAGAIVAVACLAYLVLWWRTVNPAGTVWQQRGVDVARARAARPPSACCSATRSRCPTLAFAARGADGAAAVAPPPVAVVAPHRGHRRAGVPGRRDDAVSHRRAARDAPPATRRRCPRVQTGVRLTVVAVDGLDLAFLERLVARGPDARVSRGCSPAPG